MGAFAATFPSQQPQYRKIRTIRQQKRRKRFLFKVTSKNCFGQEKIKFLKIEFLEVASIYFVKKHYEKKMDN
jgi:hypothetical protein